MAGALGAWGWAFVGLVLLLTSLPFLLLGSIDPAAYPFSAGLAFLAVALGQWVGDRWSQGVPLWLALGLALVVLSLPFVLLTPVDSANPAAYLVGAGAALLVVGVSRRIWDSWGDLPEEALEDAPDEVRPETGAAGPPPLHLGP
jgi:hypothetical protein